VAKKTLVDLGLKLCDIPSEFSINPKIDKLLEARKAGLKSNKPIDWATGEKLAFASILHDGIGIRITGQDSGRGTFSHRHSVLHNQDERKQYIPLQHINEKADYDVADSNLSEYGVLGFEYGYSIHNPKQLVVWEAQFGDFANGAQIMFDQFIASGETKWMQLSGLVCLLPHGYEGQGPEHSSARLERFLQMVAEDNMIVANPTNPASLFHLLRRQVMGNVRKPLIIMSPKSLLRHKLAVSNLSDLDKGSKFVKVIDDNVADAKKTKRVIFCSGKIYYDLFQAREDQKIKNIAVIRLEQLHPFPEEEIKKILSKYSNVKDIVWCQEEPENMGAWSFVQPRFMELLSAKHDFSYIGRRAASSPATGYGSHHKAEQAEIVENCLG
jgi:2-oxoglutarate dehydrogenase E1 component